MSVPDFAAPFFSSWAFGRRLLRNRFVMAPMTRRFAIGGRVGEDVAAYYRRRAEGGVGLIITEGGYVDPPSAPLQPDIPAFFRDEALRDWEKIISAAHAAGVAVIPQLWHGRPTEEGGAAGPAPDRPEAARRRASSWAEEYARAAGRIRQIGFDGLELHGGGKHTADLFSLAPGEDKPERPARRDRYERPAAADIIEAARSAVGPDFPIIVRISEQRRLTQTPFARDEAELLALLRPCVEAGADMFHLEATDGLSRRNGEAPSAEGSFAARVGGLLRLPVIAAGQIAVADAAETAKRLRLLAPAAARGDIALLALGRALLADPDWVNKLRAGRLDTAVGYEEKMLERLF